MTTLQEAVKNDPNYRPVLDFGFVGLVDVMGDDDSIARAARVSYGSGTKTVRENTGLIRYLLKNAHTSPFEMVEFLFHIKMPIFVARQHIRHRTASVNEYSGRYSEMSGEFYLPEKTRMQTQGVANKQGSEDPLDSFDQTMCWEAMANSYAQSQTVYTELLQPKPLSGNQTLSRELARVVLPVSNYTEMYWKIDLKNLLHYIGLRMDSHAQWEIQQYALAMAEFVKQRCPITYQAFIDYQFESTKLCRGETQLLQDIVGISNTNNISMKQAFIDLTQTHGGQQTLCLHYGISAKELDEFSKKIRCRI